MNEEIYKSTLILYLSRVQIDIKQKNEGWEMYKYGLEILPFFFNLSVLHDFNRYPSNKNVETLQWNKTP